MKAQPLHSQRFATRELREWSRDLRREGRGLWVF